RCSSTSGRNNSPASTLGAQASRDIAHVERTRAIKTRLHGHAALRVHLVPFLGADTPVDTVDRDALHRWVDSLVAQGYALGTVELTAAGVVFRWRSGARIPPRGPTASAYRWSEGKGTRKAQGLVTCGTTSVWVPLWLPCESCRGQHGRLSARTKLSARIE